MAVSAQDVKKLREKTGAGMMDCKNALQEADGDFARAERILKELGKAAAAKRSGRATNEGRIFTAVDGDRAAILELSCETDFVARNETFVELGNELATEAATRGVSVADDGMHARVANAVSTIKENMSLRRLQLLTKGSDELFAAYVHGDSGRMGALVTVKVGDSAALESEEVKTFAFDIALHAVAFRPMFLSTDSVGDGYRTEQEEIFTKQAENLGKPENVLKGIVQGKLKKHFAEVCLLDQGFVKEEKKTVAAVATEVGKAVGTPVTVSNFAVFVVGEELADA